MTLLERLALSLGFVKAPLTSAPPYLRAEVDAERRNLPDGGVAEGQMQLYQKLSWVSTAVSKVAEAVATTSFGVYEMAGEKKTAVENHLFEQLLRSPNPIMSRFEFLFATVVCYNLTGNFYWYLNKRSESAAPLEMFIVPPHRIAPIPDGQSFIKGYLYDNGPDRVALEPWQVVHGKRYNPLNPYVGLSSLESLTDVAVGDLAMQRWNRNLFARDNAKVPGALAFADPVDDATWAKMKEDINRQHGGVRRSLMMLRNVGKGGVQWVNMAMSQRDMEFLAGRTFNKEEIYGVFAPGLASMLAVNATEANSLAGRRTFTELAVWPALVALAEKITNDLLPLYGSGLVGEFDDIRPTDRALQLQEQGAAEAVMTVDEVRARFYDLSPLGDERGNMLPAQVASVAVGAPADAGQGEQPVTTPEEVKAERPILGYHIETGVVTQNEARASLGLPPVDDAEGAQLRSLRGKLEIMVAARNAGLPPEVAAQLVGLAVALPAPPPATPPVAVAEPGGADPEDDGEPEPEPDAAAAKAQEGRQFRKWLKRRPGRDLHEFKAVHLSHDDLHAIAAEVRGEADTEQPPFEMAGKAIRDLPYADGADRQRAALERKHEALIATALAAWLRKVVPPGTNAENVTPDSAEARLNEHKGILRDALYAMMNDAAQLGLTTGQAQVDHLMGVRKAMVNVGGMWDLANQAVIAWLLGNTDYPGGTGYVDNVLTRMLISRTREVRTIIAEWITNQQPLSALVEQLRPMFGAERARMVAVTEVTRAYSEGNQAAWRAGGIIDRKRWETSADEAVCKVCAPLQGQEQPLDADFQSEFQGVAGGPPAHAGCVVGGTLVASPSIQATTKRWYTGEVIEIATESGNLLTVTPNHPVLTNQGWVAAGALQVGDHVISSFDGEATCAAVDPNDYNRPAIIEDVLEAFGGAGSVVSVSVPSTAEDFHGDGGKGDVEIVGANGFLSDGVSATFQQPRGKLPFVVGDKGLTPLSPQSGLATLLESGDTPAGGGIGGSGVALVFVCPSCGHHELIGVADVADVYSGEFQAPTNGVAADPEIISESLLGFTGKVASDNFVSGQHIFPRPAISQSLGSDSRNVPLGTKQAASGQFILEGLLTGMPAAGNVLDAFSGKVFADRVLKVSRSNFAGHVYNLQTSTGWYVANNIITHNCRCWVTPVVD